MSREGASALALLVTSALAAGVAAACAGATLPAEGKSCCKGLNECKGKGGCKTDEHDCAGKNERKGHGGCSAFCPR